MSDNNLRKVESHIGEALHRRRNSHWRNKVHANIGVSGSSSFGTICRVISCAFVFGATHFAFADDAWTDGVTDPQTGSVDGRGVLLWGVCGKGGYIGTEYFHQFSTMEDSAGPYLTITPTMKHLTKDTYVTEAGNPGISSKVRDLLSGGDYTTLESGASFSIDISGLVAGRKYLVQFWVCDARGNHAAYYLDFGPGLAKAYYEGSESLSGGYATCVFTAEDSAKSFSITPSHVRSAQINAIQLRDLDAVAAPVAWKVDWTSGEKDVANDGRLLYAYHGDQDVEQLRVNGVPFNLEASKASSWDDNVSFSPSLGSRYSGFFNDSGNLGYSAAYQNLLKGGWYDGSISKSHIRKVQLRQLTNGKRYLVQMWFCDNRNAVYCGRRAELDNSSAFAYLSKGAVGSPGSVATGWFTAKADSQDIVVFSTSTNKTIQPFLGSMQVREVNGDYPVNANWVTGETDSKSGSVATDGTLLYAYAGNPTEIGGVVFSLFGPGLKLGDNVEFADSMSSIRSADGTARTYIGPGAAEADELVKKLLGGSVYCNNLKSSVVTLKKLRPGRRYLAQFWSCDSRTGFGLRSLTFDGQATVNFGEPYPLGNYATCVFTATNTQHSIVAVQSAYAWQVNALQVRLLDEVDDTVVWTGGDVDTGTWTRSYFVKATNGRTMMSAEFPELRRAVVSEGTLAIGAGIPDAVQIEIYQPGSLEVCENCVLNNPILTGTGVVSGPGTIAFTSGGEVRMPTVSVSANLIIRLDNGTHLKTFGMTDLSAYTFQINDAKERLETGKDVLVLSDSRITGMPVVEFPASDKDRYVARWSAARSALIVKEKPGLVLFVR